MDLLIYIDCTLTPWLLVCTSVSFELGQNESVPKPSHSLLSRYSGVQTNANNQRYKERITTWKDNVAIYYKSPPTAEMSWTTKSLGNYVSDYPLTCPWEYLKKEVPKYLSWAMFVKGVGKSSSFTAIAESFAWIRSSTYSQFIKLIKMELLCLQPMQEAKAPSVQPFPIWKNIKYR